MPEALVTSGSTIDATWVMVQQCEPLNGSLAPQGEHSSIPARGQCRWLWAWAPCPCAVLHSASQEPSWWRSLESTKAMTEKLWVYYGKKRMGWMTGGTVSPSTNPVGLGPVQWACLRHTVSYLCSHVVWELGWGLRSRLCPSYLAPKSRLAESAGLRVTPVCGEGGPQVWAAPWKSSCGSTAWAGGEERGVKMLRIFVKAQEKGNFQ